MRGCDDVESDCISVMLSGVDSSGLTVRQKVQLPTLRLGHRELCLQEAIVTKLELREQVGEGASVWQPSAVTYVMFRCFPPDDENPDRSALSIRWCLGPVILEASRAGP